MFYNFRQRRLPTSPGTGNFAFMPALSLPATCNGGSGTWFQSQFRSEQPPQVYQVKTAPTGDLRGGGLIPGQIAFQGLVEDPINPGSVTP